MPKPREGSVAVYQLPDPSLFTRSVRSETDDERMAAECQERAAKLEEIAERSVESGFSYAYLKELYLTSMFHALNGDRKKPSIEDIKAAASQLMHDKKLANELFETTDHSSHQIGIA